MSELASLLRSCRSPVDLVAMTGADPAAVTSQAIVAALDATYGHPPRTKGARDVWSQVSPMPWPTKRPRRTVACIGRRGLKSSALLAWSVAFEALSRAPGHADHAAEGSRLYFVVVAPRIAQAAEALHGIRSVFDLLGTALGIRYELRDEAGSPQLTVTNPAGRCPVIVTVMTASEVAVRGFAIPFFAVDEGGFFPMEGPSSLRAVERALTPGGATFPEASSLIVSNPGAPEGLFFDRVMKPPADTVLVRAPTWIANPRVSRARCWALADEDPMTFAIEYEASRFGYSGEGFVDTSRITLGDEFTGNGPRDGFFIVAYDAGQLQDSSAFVVMSAADQEIPGSSPVRHYVVEALDTIAASKTNPPSIETIVSRACELARQWNKAPIVSDPYIAVEAKRALEARGWSQYEGAYFPGSRQYVIAPMSAPKQTPRWTTLRSVVAGGRLHIPDTPIGRELVRQLAGLTAVTLASGSLKVDGKRDDLCDAAILAIEVASKLPPTLARGCATVDVDEGFRFNGARGVYWVDPIVRKIHPNGEVEVSREPPAWHPAFEQFARDSIARGDRSPAVERWEAEQAAGISIPVRHH